MDDPWKYLAFPAAAAAGYLISLGVTAHFAEQTGLPEFEAQLVVIAIAGLIAGFMVDEVIPTYIEHIRSGNGSGSMKGGGDDFDFD